MDREKVIKETEDGIVFAESRGFGGLANTMRDALALLKEQEAVEPKINEDGEAFCECGENVGIISNNKQLPSVCMKFCPECGKPILWGVVGRSVNGRKSVKRNES